MTEPIRVLFVSTGCAARAVLAEALLRHVGGDAFEASAAGTHPVPIDPLTLRVLERAGIDSELCASRSIDDVRDQAFDYVITLCDDARLLCPVFPGADQSMHWGYPSPTKAVGTEDERLVAFERVFVQLGERIRQFVLITRRVQPATAAG